MEELKKKSVFIRITEKEKELFVEQARKCGRSLSNYITWVVNSFIQREKGE